jgi:hypothetical protein
MRALPLLFLAALGGLAAAESSAPTIEGYWQDTERRILFSRDAPPGYVYGRWTALDQEQTYPSAKHIRRAGPAFELTDLLYDDEERIRVERSDEKTIEFVRSNTWSGCTARHSCELQGTDALFCALETRCPKGEAQELVWRGEERYTRRVSCVRVDKRQAQGIPVRCR